MKQTIEKTIFEIIWNMIHPFLHIKQTTIVMEESQCFACKLINVWILHTWSPSLYYYLLDTKRAVLDRLGVYILCLGFAMSRAVYFANEIGTMYNHVDFQQIRPIFFCTAPWNEIRDENNYDIQIQIEIHRKWRNVNSKIHAQTHH